MGVAEPAAGHQAVLERRLAHAQTTGDRELAGADAAAVLRRRLVRRDPRRQELLRVQHRRAARHRLHADLRGHLRRGHQHGRRQHAGRASLPANDLHCTPGIVMDSAGVLHVVAGAHGKPFKYAHSSAPLSTTGWTKPINVLDSGYRCADDRRRRAGQADVRLACLRSRRRAAHRLPPGTPQRRLALPRLRVRRRSCTSPWPPARRSGAGPT